jgi:hypothetical protein
LHGDPHWSHDEIVEVQTRVLRALLDQRRPKRGSSPITVPTVADQQ